MIVVDLMHGVYDVSTLDFLTATKTELYGTL